MTLVDIPVYCEHSLFRKSDVRGKIAFHAMRYAETMVVDSESFLSAQVLYRDAVYPDENKRSEPIVNVMFSKGGTCCSVRTTESAFMKIFGCCPHV